MKVVKGYGAPDATTMANVNDLYVDLDTSDVYRCTNVNTIGEEWGGTILYAAGLDNTVHVWEKVSGGASGGSGLNMTDDGAEIYVIMDGIKSSFIEAQVGDMDAQLADAMGNSVIKVLVRDTMPYIGYGLQDIEEVKPFYLVLSETGQIYNYIVGDGWRPAFGDIPSYGWIDKTAFDALDAADENNNGIYTIRSTSYPLVDGTLVDFKSDGETIRSMFGVYAFLNTVDIPNAKTIGIGAFMSCVCLTSVNFPNVVYIGKDAFYGCHGLTSIDLPHTLKMIDANAFAGCTKLTSLTYDGTVEEWHAIQFGTEWNAFVPATEVICSDGTVSLD